MSERTKKDGASLSGARSELGLIAHIRKSFAPRRRAGGIALGIGDDCAVLAPKPGWEVLVTTDLLLEGRHFGRDLHAPESVGHRCIARGLSDIAAMGGAPLAAFLSLGLPSHAMNTISDRRWVERFLEGLRAMADAAGVVLAGGDTGEVASGGLVADIVLVGQAPPGTALRRSGARVGDGIYVTGALGGAAAELERMMEGRGRRQRRRGQLPGTQPQSYPEPRLAVGAALRQRALATACLDVSDGLSTDLRHLCEASGVGAEVWAEMLPMHALAAGPRALERALHGGEDYELLFTARRRVPRSIAGVAVTRIGKIVAPREGVVLVLGDGRKEELRAGGWEHLRS